MSMVFILVPLAVVLMAGAAAALFWAVNSGQYDDFEGAERAALEPDESPGDDAGQ